MVFSFFQTELLILFLMVLNQSTYIIKAISAQSYVLLTCLPGWYLPFMFAQTAYLEMQLYLGMRVQGL